MKEIRRIDEWRGVGELFANGKSLGRYPYVIDVYQEFITTAGFQSERQEVPGLQDLKGRLLQTDGLDLFGLTGTTLLLRLEDGREADVFLDGTSIVFQSDVREPDQRAGG